MNRRIVFFIVTGLLLSCGTVMADNTDKFMAGKSVAENWLSIVDSGKYAASYNNTSAYLRNSVTLIQWEQSMKRIRQPLGRVLTRRMLTKIFKTSLPNKPNGEYVIIQFATSFDKKRRAMETVITMQDKDKAWRVSDYQIK